MTARIRKTIKISRELKIKQAANGRWFLCHRNEAGKLLTYSSRFKGSESEFRKWLKEHRIEEIIHARVVAGVAQMVADKISSGNKRKELRELIDPWLSYLSAVGCAQGTCFLYSGLVRRFITDCRIATSYASDPTVLSAGRISEYISNSPKLHKRSSINVAISAIRSFCGWLCANGYMRNDASKLVRIPKNLTHDQKETRKAICFTPRQVEQLLDHIQKRIAAAHPRKSMTGRKIIKGHVDGLMFCYAATLLAYHFGLRRSDCAMLEKSSLSDPSKFVVWTQKRDTRVEFPLTREGILEKVAGPAFSFYSEELRNRVIEELMTFRPIVNQIACMVIDSPSSYCWPDMTTGDKSKISARFDGLLKEIGIIGPTFHSLRHTRAQQWRAIGLELDTIASLLGHKSVSSTKHYTGG